MNGGDTTLQAALSGIAGNKDARTGDKETGIGNIFDAAKVEQDIAAQTLITQTFNSLAPKAARDVATSKADDLKRQANLAATEEEKKALLEEAAKWGPTGRYSIAMNVIIGAAGGVAGASITKETLAWAADEMRQNMVEDSKKFKGLCDTQGNCISNQSGQSVGVNGDNFKLAGGRIILENWCSNGRCERDNSSVSGYVENTDGTVKFKPGTNADGTPMTLNQFIDNNPNWRSPLVGIKEEKGKWNWEESSSTTPKAHSGTNWQKHMQERMTH